MALSEREVPGVTRGDKGAGTNERFAASCDAAGSPEEMAISAGAAARFLLSVETSSIWAVDRILGLALAEVV